MYRVEMYARVRRACRVEGMGTATGRHASDPVAHAQRRPPFVTRRPSCGLRLASESPPRASHHDGAPAQFVRFSTPTLTGRLRASPLGLTPPAVCLRSKDAAQDTEMRNPAII